ncbi:MAG TPA: tRNA (adenosine(37)-N6)-dimethylallyltransferase MiaA [Chthoniobacterales bacterium]|jgi:tRNA dimethylallyltransferase|nr:tRNA (adenosine(37)-N6)-dimethylallyltransferase MiaA [Chthoniobacterales bacterium]
MHKLRYMVLAGPTAVGKTDLAIQVAQRLQSEIVGGDAFQLYQRLDILTGKPTLSQLAAIPHHLVGIIPITDLCDVHKYSLLARQTIAGLNERGIIPLVVGGTGFYLQGLEGVIPQLPPVDLALRAELHSRSVTDLLRELEDRDPIALNRIDRKNRRRLIRALEVCISSGKPFSSFSQQTATDPAIARIVLQQTRSVLVERINRRVDEMFERGVVAEVAAVEAIGPTASKAIGFQLIRSLLAGTIDISACREAIKQQTRHYAKRQMTWFRRPLYEIVAAESSAESLTATFRRRLSEFTAR